MTMLRLVCAVSILAASLPLAAQAPATTTPATAARAATRGATKLLPGTRGNVLTTIQGNALTSTNGPLPDALVRLRDARFGRIVDTELTDQSGLFTFRGVDPGTYVVELMDKDSQTILAASQMLNVNGGEA